MILDISDASFRKILDDNQLYLPIRWTGDDFLTTTERLFHRYINRLKSVKDEDDRAYLRISVNLDKIEYVTAMLAETIRHYLNGFPAKSYNTFEQAMGVLVQNPFLLYDNSTNECFNSLNELYDNDNLTLFRAVIVDDNKLYQRSRVFHTPYNLRSKVSTCRYSIAGYPSLYLGTSLHLCCNEIAADRKNCSILASIFKYEQSIERSTVIQVVDLAVKPQDFLEKKDGSENWQSSRQQIIKRAIHNATQRTHTREKTDIRYAYLLWYPLIAACSFIRTNHKDPFAAEYIIPQLLMQWVRNRTKTCNNGCEDIQCLIGIRYFSCASELASDLGFNYVFPTSGRKKSIDLPYCEVLAKSFQLATPVYVHEYESISICERALDQSKDYDYIGF